MSLFFEIHILILLSKIGAYDFQRLIKIMLISHDQKSASFFEML